jgi:hypothetical protein
MSLPIYGGKSSNEPCVLRPPEGQDINPYLSRLYGMLYQLSRMNDKDTFIERLDNLQQEIQTVIASRAVRAAPPR